MMITDNKIITDQIFRSLKIPQPETLFYIFHGHLYSPEMVQLTQDQIEHELNNTSIEKIFVKPAQGSGGYGINIFHKTDRGRYETRDNIIFNGDFLAMLQKNQDYIVQGGVTQDPEISGIYPGSVNTFRIIAENMNGSVRVVCAMLRVGRGQSEVDNISSGGICTYIDVNSGKFGDFAISYTGERFEKHPDTQFAFRNFYLSRWDDIKRFTIEAAGRMPFFTYLGWDITLTANGPLVIEVNANPAHDVMEMSYAGLREAFGIEDPDYYWKNPGKRM
jgi:hypothetical protein